MSLRIYETDPEAKPKKRDRFSSDLVFNLKSGIQVNNAPVALDNWGFTTDDPSVAEVIAQRYGGDIEELDVEKGDDHRVLSTVNTLDVLVAGPDALRSRMILFGMQGVIHECDGMYFLNEEDRGEPCGCPAKLEDRKALAAKGRGPKPSIELRFLLADDPEMGFGRFRTGSWSLVKELADVEDSLQYHAERSDGNPILVRLELERVEYTTKTGRNVSYVRPVINVVGPTTK